MTPPVIIVRPEPGAAQTAARACALGLNPVLRPLFALTPVHWTAPDPNGFDGLLLTSANSVVYGGDALRNLTSLPVLAVGAATAQAAEDAGFSVAIAGEGAAQDIADQAQRAGYQRLLRLVGASPAPAYLTDGQITVCQVYTATGLTPHIAPVGPAIVLLHSTKAAQRFAQVFAGNRSETDVIAISAKVAVSAGVGWQSISVADRAGDDALLALAQNLCEQRAS